MSFELPYKLQINISCRSLTDLEELLEEIWICFNPEEKQALI